MNEPKAFLMYASGGGTILDLCPLPGTYSGKYANGLTWKRTDEMVDGMVVYRPVDKEPRQ